MIDLHAHVLPAVDDGARDLAEALAMLRMAEADGTRVLCATPHVLGPSLDVDPRAARAAHEALSAAARSEGLRIDVRLGGEIWYRPDLPDLARAGRLPTYAAGGRRYALVEFPPTHVPPGAAETFFRLRLEGVTPVVAHPERNPGFRERPADALALREGGALLQVTAGALTGEFRDDVLETARWLARRGGVDLIASDAHRRDRRAPGLSAGAKVLARWAGKGAAERAVEGVPLALLSGEEPPRGP